MADMPWYKNESLKFSCTGCGKCCTGSPGYVWVSDEEAKRIAAFLGISVVEFIHKYTHILGGRRSLKEMGPEYDCIFLKGKRCQIYEERPKQCRTFPWWKENLESPESWNETSLRCEGINHSDAPVIAFEEIEKHLD